MGSVERKALVLQCDTELTVLEVEEDREGEWSRAKGRPLAVLIDPDGLVDFFDFKLALRESGAQVLGQLICKTDGGQARTHSCVGFRREDRVTVIVFGGKDPEPREGAVLDKDMHRHLDEMSSLNNEVINAKREAMQKSAENSRLLERQRELNAKLEETIAMKDRLFSLLSHDLRSPIAGMMDLVSLLELGDTTYWEILEMGLITNIRKMGDRTLDLLSDLTLWYKATHESGVVRRTPVPVDPLFERVAEHFQASLIREKLQLTRSCDGDLFADADERVMETVMRNLLSNAIKFTPAGGRIRMAAKQTANQIEISVTDSGVGISEERLGQLFHIAPDNSDRGVRGEKGLGLGLVLCKELLEQVEGTIEARSEAGEGSVFTVRLGAFQD